MKLLGCLSGGFPTLDTALPFATALSAGGCDVIVMDFPSRRPLWETPAAASRMEAALAACADYTRYLRVYARIHDALPSQQFAVQIYEDTLKIIGADRFLEFCFHCNIRQVLYLGMEDCYTSDYLLSCGIQVFFPLRYPLDHRPDWLRYSGASVLLQVEKPASDTRYSLGASVTRLRHLAGGRSIHIYVDSLGSPQDRLALELADCDGGMVSRELLDPDNIPPEAVEDTLRALREDLYPPYLNLPPESFAPVGSRLTTSAPSGYNLK